MCSNGAYEMATEFPPCCPSHTPDVFLLGYLQAPSARLFFTSDIGMWKMLGRKYGDMCLSTSVFVIVVVRY